MPSDRLASAGRSSASREEVLFTPESANRSLVLVRRIVADVLRHYQVLMDLRTQRESLSVGPASAQQLDELRVRAEAVVETLRGYHDELSDIGCLLKDFATGLVDFPAMIDDRKVYLCWKYDEPAVAHWHELDAGYRARKPLTAQQA